MKKIAGQVYRKVKQLRNLRVTTKRPQSEMTNIEMDINFPVDTIANYFWDVLKDNEDISASDIFKGNCLNITRPVTGLACDIDLPLAKVTSLLAIAYKMASLEGQKIYLFTGAGSWVPAVNKTTEDITNATSSSGSLELAFVDKQGRLEERLSIFLWMDNNLEMECTAPNAPIKKILAEAIGSMADFKSDQVFEKIDIVYTWVNGEDPEWRDLLTQHKDIEEIDWDRYHQEDELKYSIRSILLHAPWVGTIYVFTNCQPPEWFEETDRIKWVRHEDVVPEKYLPLFNSTAIETFLHLIPGLSEDFVYFNDDVFLSGFVRPKDFFTQYGQGVSRLEPYGITPLFWQSGQSEGEDPWRTGIVNAAKRLEKDLGHFPTRVHRHSPHALKKSTYEQMVEKYATELDAVRSSRFRSPEDMIITSFFYHYFALSEGKSVEINENSAIIRPGNFKNFVSKKSHTRVRFFCVNDGAGSSSNKAYNDFKRKTIPGYFPFKSPAER